MYTGKIDVNSTTCMHNADILSSLVYNTNRFSCNFAFIALRQEKVTHIVMRSVFA